MNTLRASRVVIRLGIPAAALCLFLLWWNFGFLRVPVGMDTLPDTHPPGTLCLIGKGTSGVRSGSVVFIDLDDGGTLLARVGRVLPDSEIAVRVDNRESPFVYLEAGGPYPLGKVRGLVLTQFPPGP